MNQGSRSSLASMSSIVAAVEQLSPGNTFFGPVWRQENAAAPGTKDRQASTDVRLFSPLPRYRTDRKPSPRRHVRFVAAHWIFHERVSARVALPRPAETAAATR